MTATPFICPVATAIAVAIVVAARHTENSDGPWRLAALGCAEGKYAMHARYYAMMILQTKYPRVSKRRLAKLVGSAAPEGYAYMAPPKWFKAANLPWLVSEFDRLLSRYDRIPDDHAVVSGPERGGTARPTVRLSATDTRTIGMLPMATSDKRKMRDLLAEAALNTKLLQDQMLKGDDSDEN